MFCSIYISLFLSTVSQVNHSSYSSRSLDTVDVESFGDVSVTCVEKLKVISALQEAVERGEKESISKAIYAHSHWLNGNQAEYAYKQAWVQYSNEDYHSSLGTLSSPPLSPPPLTLSPFVHLLCGACHSKLDHPNLALLHWRRSMETGHTPNHTPFLASLHNSAIAYTAMGNTVAAVATRRLEIEALRCQSDCDTVSLPLWVWLHNEEGGASVTRHSPAVAMFCMAWQLASGRRYDEASQTLRDCLALVEDGAVVGSSFPLPSSLHLLRALCEVAREGEGVRRGKNMCLELLKSSSPGNDIWRSQVMCVLATASLHLGESSETREWGVRCLGEVEKMLCEVKDKQIHQQLHQLKVLQQHSQMLLAIVAIANSHWREALQLLACVLATPTGLFNHCLLQCRVGVVMGGAGGWLERRGSTPVGRSDARDKLRHSQQLLHTVTGFERDYMAMDIAMLKIWLQHNR
ncbi:hypothetical protein GBAR_LOCUS25061 [Geodia barretti]|uniref:Uncharacterized protein n=1 Tax=Geodia barretti TaxID=519541 RepID=A0AA35TC76_GEOBA|nr:hypothetical protein GBAR_LOCUS25061 [Geodia barretti]